MKPLWKLIKRLTNFISFFKPRLQLRKSRRLPLKSMTNLRDSRMITITQLLLVQRLHHSFITILSMTHLLRTSQTPSIATEGKSLLPSPVIMSHGPLSTNLRRLSRITKRLSMEQLKRLPAKFMRVILKLWPMLQKLTTQRPKRHRVLKSLQKNNENHDNLI